MTKKILVLGHNGMLGNAVVKYFSSQPTYEVLTTTLRWGDPLFNDALEKTEASVIINCIGAIPQKKPTDEMYTAINVLLPTFLETLGKNILHPTTDCEFLGTIPKEKKYTRDSVRDANDAYGKSKATISELIEKSFVNTKIIRTSIIGHELNSQVSLLDWFLNSEKEVLGYTHHYWNGITTLQWAKIAEKIIHNWENHPTLNQFGTEQILSKYEVLIIAKKVYKKNIDIKPVALGTDTNKCLACDSSIPSLEEQLYELKNFYGK